MLTEVVNKNMIGKTVSNFKIVEKLGGVGMGEVYRATDTRLKRPVVLKFLPRHYTNAPDAERFEREAQSAAALNHPNVITIYEIGEFEGQIFIAMEFVDGKELRELIGPALALPRALEIAVQVADGLHGAHDAGIVHRDIKPENILVTDEGRVKIVDFGLAKLHGVTRITQESSTVGTLHYMSPEQTRGKHVDHRSDIFSFGAVLYEMITGAAAFPGNNAVAVTNAILLSAPQPVQKLNPEAGDELERIVMKCLEKNREERYQNFKEVLVDLRTVAGISSAATPMPGTTPERPAARAASTGRSSGGSGWLRFGIPVVVVALAIAVWTMRGGSPDTAPTPVAESPHTPGAQVSAPITSGKTMIAVLPFENMGDTGDDYFADGMTEEITSRLASVRGLGVISRTSAMQYKGTQKSLQEIGEELGVSYVLEGTVRWSRSGGEDRVRITPQLITVKDDTHLWSDRYDRTLEDIFEVQSEIAQNIVRELGISLGEGEQMQFGGRPTDNMQAYQSYLRGVDMWRDTGSSAESYLAMIPMFDEAVGLDPKFADALRYLTFAHSAMAHWGFDRTEERMALAEGYAQRCLEVAPESFAGYHALGTYYYWCRRDYEAALEALDRAAELRPSNPDVIATRSDVRRRMGLYREAIADMELVLELDPRAHDVAQEVADTYMSLREFDTARRYFQRAIEIVPDNPLPYHYVATLYLAQGDLDAAKAMVEQMPEDSQVRPETRMWVDYMAKNIDGVTSIVQTVPAEKAIVASTIYTPYAALAARLQWVLGNHDAARAGFEAVRTRLREEIDRSPHDARLYAELSVVEAGLGNRDASAAAGQKCVELADPDLYGEPYYNEKFMNASVLLGDTDDALDRLDAILSRPAERLHPGYFRLDPMCDPLRDNPRFETILARHENKRF